MNPIIYLNPPYYFPLPVNNWYAEVYEISSGGDWYFKIRAGSKTGTVLMAAAAGYCTNEDMRNGLIPPTRDAAYTDICAGQGWTAVVPTPDE